MFVGLSVTASSVAGVGTRHAWTPLSSKVSYKDRGPVGSPAFDDLVPLLTIEQ